MSYSTSSSPPDPPIPKRKTSRNFNKRHPIILTKKTSPNNQKELTTEHIQSYHLRSRSTDISLKLPHQQQQHQGTHHSRSKSHEVPSSNELLRLMPFESYNNHRKRRSNSDVGNDESIEYKICEETNCNNGSSYLLLHSSSPSPSDDERPYNEYMASSSPSLHALFEQVSPPGGFSSPRPSRPSSSTSILSNSSHVSTLSEGQPQRSPSRPGSQATSRSHRSSIPGSQATSCRPGSQSSSFPRRRSFQRTSMNSIFVDQTMYLPDDESILKTVAYILSQKLQEGSECTKEEIERRSLKSFELNYKERGLNSDFFKTIPTEIQVFRFLISFFKRAQLSSESNIVALAYLDQVLSKTKIIVTKSNWHCLIFGAYCLASKVFDDLSMLSCDFSLAVPLFTVQDIQNLEVLYLNILEYKTDVSPSLYAEVYFLLRDIHVRQLLLIEKKRELERESQKLELEMRQQQQEEEEEELQNHFKDGVMIQVHNSSSSSSSSSSNNNKSSSNGSGYTQSISVSSLASSSSSNDIKLKRIFSADDAKVLIYGNSPIKKPQSKQDSLLSLKVTLPSLQSSSSSKGGGGRDRNISHYLRSKSDKEQIVNIYENNFGEIKPQSSVPISAL